MKSRRGAKTVIDAELAFTEAFKAQMGELYWLAYLITGDQDQSVRAFTSALDCNDANSTFRQFMISWARRLVVVAALSFVNPQLRRSILRAQQADRDTPEKFAHCNVDFSSSPDIGAVTRYDLEQALLAIDIFPRCALLLTVFEGLHVSDVGSLLSADPQLVKAAYSDAAVQLTRNIGLRRAIATDGDDNGKWFPIGNCVGRECDSDAQRGGL
jgi:DNA-directed RNA polymerase specialized sigma24 family protein